MEIDLGKAIVINVKLNGKVYELREPTIDDVEKMSDIDKEDGRAANRALQQFAIDLGMPEDVVKSLGILKLKALAEGLTGSFSEKK